MRFNNVKTVCDFAVENSIQVLENNEEFEGVVFTATIKRKGDIEFKSTYQLPKNSVLGEDDE